MFAVTGENRIAHSYVNIKTGVERHQSQIRLLFNAAMDMPAYLTTVRGRGGLGSANQKLQDVFWQMTTSTSGGTAIQALLHFYIAVSTAKTDAQMLVSYGFPQNTWSPNTASKISTNDGTLAPATGLKLYVAAAAVPLADYYGFYVLRMTPFFKSTGANEIEVVVNSARAVKCWLWGSNNGAGFA